MHGGAVFLRPSRPRDWWDHPRTITVETTPKYQGMPSRPRICRAIYCNSLFSSGIRIASCCIISPEILLWTGRERDSKSIVVFLWKKRRKNFLHVFVEKTSRHLVHVFVDPVFTRFLSESVAPFCSVFVDTIFAWFRSVRGPDRIPQYFGVVPTVIALR